MKKKIFYGLAVAALATAGFAIADDASRLSLTPSQIENLEALSDPEILIEYDKICLSGKDYCVLSPTAVIEGVPKN